MKTTEKLVSELVIGDVIVWNFGELTTITGFSSKTAKTVVIEQEDKNGNPWKKRQSLNTNRVVKCI